MQTHQALNTHTHHTHAVSKKRRETQISFELMMMMMMMMMMLLPIQMERVLTYLFIPPTYQLYHTSHAKAIHTCNVSDTVSKKKEEKHKYLLN
jgi:nitrogen fixation/metabolism regulation signal transduction histidine kinase